MTREELVKLAHRFMRLSPTTRLQIAEDIGVDEGLADQDLTTSEEALEILRRVAASEKTAALAVAMARKSA